MALRLFPHTIRPLLALRVAPAPSATATAELVTAPVLPTDDRAGDGYDWMDTLEGTEWSVLPNWGSDGWEAGSWPYIIFAVAHTRDGNGEMFGYGTWVEGDTSTYWFRSQGACFEAIAPLLTNE